MYARTFSSVLTTFAVGAGAAAPPQAVAQVVRPSPGHRPVDHDVAVEQHRESVAEQQTSTAEAEVSDAGHQYDVSGLASAEDLATPSPAASRAEHLGRALRIPVATAFATPLTASQDTCMGSRVFGFQVASFGISFATTWQDRNCRRLKNARQLFALGYPEAAVQLLCMDEEVYAAMERAGTPCPGVRFISLPPEPPPAAEPPPLISFDDVLFDFDRSTLRPEASAILDPLLAMLQADPSMSIDIEGHTDWIGSDAYNQGLSQRRAQAVVNWLVAHGIARERISAVGRGESEPVATNHTAAGRQLNRRVEIRRRDPNPPLASGG
jgi:outer membrane protein OmpA-like peptidoglycan-associated protein